MATKEREEIKRTTKKKMARRHSKEGGNHLEQKCNRQGITEGTVGCLHPALDGQILSESLNRKATDRGQWKTLVEGYILQWTDKSYVKGET